MKKQYISILGATLMLFSHAASAQVLFYEGFDDVTALSGDGWMMVNNSEPMGPETWAQGDGGVGVDAYSGDATSYVGNSYLSTSASDVGTISDWLISPPIELMNGDNIALMTISYNSATYPDRIEVRISPNGGSDVGSDENSVGDFTELVFSVNPDLTTEGYPSVTVNDDTWTLFSGMVSGLTGATNCRVAVRYFVPDAGGAGSNSSSIGIDDFAVVRGGVGIDESSSLEVALAPNPTNGLVWITLPDNGAYTAQIFSASGQLVHTERLIGSSTLDFSGFEAGMYIVDIRDLATETISRSRVVKN